MEFTGRCHCGQYTCAIRQEPLVQFYCHCKGCQRNFGGGVRPNLCLRIPDVDESLKFGKAFKFSSPRALLSYPAAGGHRCFCPTCHTPVFAVLPAAEIVSIPVTMFDDYPFKPMFHVNCNSNAFSRRFASHISDGLPKYADLPEEIGGSGKLFQTPSTTATIPHSNNS